MADLVTILWTQPQASIPYWSAAAQGRSQPSALQQLAALGRVQDVSDTLGTLLGGEADWDPQCFWAMKGRSRMRAHGPLGALE